MIGRKLSDITGRRWSLTPIQLSKIQVSSASYYNGKAAEAVAVIEEVLKEHLII
jgi:hypothetical protein